MSGSLDYVLWLVTPTPTSPPVPANLVTLPVKGKIVADIRGARLFELPALYVYDNSMSKRGPNKGRIVGVVNGGDPVTVVDVAWSWADETFYVLIESPGGKGWIASEGVEVSHP
jgi:hypothetical protein